MKLLCPCGAPVFLVRQVEEVQAVTFTAWGLQVNLEQSYTGHATFYRCDACGKRWDSLDAATLPEPQQE